ncbi:MAG: MBOAT family protein, partial [Solobacterium sp.]|nr:MBOAT family protein [Solobacterium sp.]
LTGLWHGASWNFILWGLFYGLILILEKQFLYERLKKLPSYISHIYTLLIVLIAWVLFAFTDLQQGLHYLAMMFGKGVFANGMTLFLMRNNFVLFLICALACTPIAKTRLNIFRRKECLYLRPLLVLLALLICTAFIVDASYNPFLYFRF